MGAASVVGEHDEDHRDDAKSYIYNKTSADQRQTQHDVSVMTDSGGGLSR